MGDQLATIIMLAIIAFPLVFGLMWLGSGHLYLWVRRRRARRKLPPGRR